MCLRIGEHYIFLKEEVMLKENDTRLNEFWGMNILSSLMPKTTSDWVHLGVDGVSSILDGLGVITEGFTSWIAKFIEAIHAISYFVEAQYKPQEKIGLYIGGAITAAFAVFMPITGSAQATLVKAEVKKAGWGLGSIFRTLAAGKIGVGYAFIKRLLSFIGNISIIKRPIGTLIEKVSQTAIGKLMMNIPVIKGIMKFFRNDLDLALEKAGKHLAADNLVYTRSAVRESEPMMMTAYNGLNTEAKKLINPKEFVEINKALVHKQLTGLPMGGKVAKYSDEALNTASKFWASNQGGTGREAIQAITNTNVATLNTTLTKATGDVMALVDGAVAKDTLLSGVKKVAIKDATRKGIADTLLKQARSTGSVETLSVVMKKFSSKSVAEIVVVALKSGSKLAVGNGLKNAVMNGITPSTDSTDSSATSGDSTSSGGAALPIDTAPAADAAARDAAAGKIDTNTKVEGDAKNAENKTQLAKSFTEQNHLKLAEVDTKEALGNLGVEFRTPHKDNTDGKLILTGDILEAPLDVTATLHSYEKKETLLTDLKMLNGKEDKTTVRDGEYKKWERSNTFTTPFVKADSGRYVFHFLVRDRSIISLVKKDADEKLVWTQVLTPDVLEKGYFKINSSIYILVKKVTDKGYDE